MSDDHWLKELAEMKREQDAEAGERLDERWDRLSAGTLSPEEEAELKALAGASPEASEAYEAFRPLGADFQASVVQAIRKQGLAPKGEPTPRPAVVVPFRRRAAVWLSGAAAVAAMLLFFLLRLLPSYPALPTYALATVTGDQQFRGGSESVQDMPVFTNGSTLSLNAIPEHAVENPVEALGVARKGGGELLPLAVTPEVAHGAVRLEGTVGQEIALSPGDWRIWIVIGRPGKMPSLDELKTKLPDAGAEGEGWKAVSTQVRIVPGPAQ